MDINIPRMSTCREQCLQRIDGSSGDLLGGAPIADVL